MAIFEQGIKRRNNRSNFQKLKKNGMLNYTLTPVRVTDIILDEKHSSFSNWSDVGVVFFEYVDDTIAVGSTKAYPIFSQQQTPPLINEIVFIISMPNNLDYDSGEVSLRFYYFSPVGVHNTGPNNNIQPDSLPFSQFFQNEQNKANYKDTGGNNVDEGESSEPVINFNSLNSNENSQNTFIEKSNIYPLLPFMGDYIIEGRFGQSIRLGSTAKSKSEQKNNWSKSGDNGDPIMILRNGQSPLTSGPGWIPTTENIKDDLSSIYLTSTQKLNFSLANENFVSYVSSNFPSPILPSNYNKPQIILNSDRIVLNAKKDSVLISGEQSVLISSNQSLNLEAKSTHIVSTNIKLGSSDDGQLEPVLKGDTTVEYLKIIVQEIANLATALKTIQVYSGPNVEGVPDAAIQGPAKLAALNLEEVLGQLDSIKSNFVKTT
tara:strand:+ start:1971 stop:3266 length:1296 start_codon:yes stop_codon:yes gene_type:complete